MIKYCFILDEELGTVKLGAGCSDEYYVEIGMQQRDVQQSDKDFQWYLKEKCPMKTEEEKIKDRKDNFESQFMETSKGWYRLTPKGYANAQQSIDTINNMVAVLGALTSDIATMILFYEKPDYTKPEECTEEWLLQHQYSIQPMTKEEWTEFYVEFTTLYAKKMYMMQLLGQIADDIRL